MYFETQEIEIEGAKHQIQDITGACTLREVYRNGDRSVVDLTDDGAISPHQVAREIPHGHNPILPDHKSTDVQEAFECASWECPRHRHIHERVRRLGLGYGASREHKKCPQK